MRVTVVPASALTADDDSRWSAIQGANPSLDSACFCPEFTRAVAAVYDDVRVALVDQDGERVGYFPFQRSRLGYGRAIGAGMSDFQGPIIRPDVAWDARALVAACGLASWEFDHLVASLPPFASFQARVDESPYMDLSSGFETYRRSREQSGRRPFSTLATLGRKLERDRGPVRVVLDTGDAAVFDRVIAWKSRKAEASGGRPMPRDEVALLRAILATRTERFSGMLSALFVGDELAAAHMGMRSRTVWHYWFPAYSAEWSRYSPGLLLLLRMAEAAPSIGVRRIDLGKGGEEYKLRLMSGALRVAEGSVTVPSLAASARAGARALAAGVRSLSIGERLRARGRRVQRFWRPS